MKTVRLFSNAVLAVVNVVVGSLLLFLLYRYLLASLGPELLGVWSLLVASISAARLSDMGMAGGSTRYVASSLAKGDDVLAARIVETSVLTIFGAGLLLSAVLFPLVRIVLLKAVPTALAPLVVAVLPWVLLAFVIGLAAGVLLSSLDGCQRIDLRVCVIIAGQLILLVGSVILVPRQGLLGVAQAQCLQSVGTLVLAWLLLRRQLAALPWLPFAWSRHAFRSIFAYSAEFQLNNLLVLFVDPVTKLLLARFGGLTATAYFDMANQLIQRLRQALVAAAQVLVPAAALANESGTQPFRNLYSKSYRALFAIAVPYFLLTAALVPTLSMLWIGHREPMFERIAWIALVGLSLNTIGTPAYFSNLGSGHIRTNTLGLALGSLLTGLLGWLGGYYLQAYGVAIGYVAAMAMSSIYIQLDFHKRNNLPLSLLVPKESLALLGVSCLGSTICLVVDLAYFAARTPAVGSAVWIHVGRALLLVAIFFSVVGHCLWSHPMRRSLWARSVGAKT